ncbi:unnamed protein product [Schistosoma margrebowiei]|uniref:Uncharacterized protein n=1 Tax=Schistosoma margrebowiei TaxID=48269 RepID=A0A183NA55_9TREM|nr:unnamed protein product [Schistosoma margrebowiei]
MNQSSYISWNNRSSRSYHAIHVEVLLLTVLRCDSSKVFPSDNQHDSDAAFPQGGVGLEKVDLKNAHLTLSHGSSSPAVRSQQVRSKTKGSNSKSEGEVVLLTVLRCDSSKVFPSDNQHDSDAAFSQGGVGLEKVDPKKSHLTLPHEFPSPAVRPFEERS